MAKGKRVRVWYTQSYGGWQGPVIIPGRQDPMSKQRPSPGGQRPSPARAPTRTSRRAGIGQGDLPHTRLKPVRQGCSQRANSSHSLNRWKERLALQHRHAGISTGSEPCILRGVLGKGPQALMTRLGPSHDEGPGTQPHIRRTPNKIVSFQFAYITQRSVQWGPLQQYIQLSFQFIYVTSKGTKCSIERRTNQHQQRVFYQSGQYYNVFLSTGQWPNVICAYNVTTLKGDNLPLL